MENRTEDIQIDLSKYYNIIVPIFISACLATFMLNVLIIVSYPLIRNLNRVTRPYITFILSLLISDSLTSLLLGMQLLLGAYLPVVHDVAIWEYGYGCIMLVCEAFKYAVFIVTVYHLLSMVVMHLAGVTAPMKFKKVMTQCLARRLVILLWIVPFGCIILTFSSISGEAFLSENCAGHDFLQKFPFRAAYSSIILFPTALIFIIYGYFHILLWYKRDITKSTVSKQNIRAAKTTLLIMFTCTCGWLPAVVNHLIICEDDVRCPYQIQDFSIETLVIMHSISYVLVIMKSFSNPLIFAIRQQNIQDALKRLFYRIRHCRDIPPNINESRRHSKYSSIRNSCKLSTVAIRDIEKSSLLKSSNML